MQDTMMIQTADSGALTRLVEELQKSKADLEAKRHTETLLARLISLMRWRNDDTLEIWTDRLLDELVLAVDGLQASLYLYEKSGGEELLHLIGVYAFDKNKIRKTIPLGEGIIGQVAKSRRASYFGAETTFESFTATSIAQVKPRALRVQPLLYNETLAGVLEISSIREFGTHETEFLLQISENIAANLINISGQEETRRLYHEMQIKSEALVSQEEEMRQNVEELQATQEEMRRVQISLKEEADRTRILLESMRDAVITIEKGRFMECNGAALRIFGCESREEFLGKGWADFSASNQISGRATSEEIPDRLVYAMNDGGTSFEWKAKRKGGEEFDSEIYLAPFDYQGGTLLLMVVRDISEQKRNEARLMEQQQQMQIAQSIARMGSWQLDLRTKNTLWSDSMYQIYNVSPEAGPLDYDMLAQMTYFEDRDAFKQSYMDLVMYGTRSNLEYRIMPRGGDVKWVRTDGFAVRNDKGDIIKVYGLVQDITEQKEKEIEVTEKNNELAARESELQKALKRATSLFNNAGDAIIILKDGLIEDINPAGLRLFGYESREAMIAEAVTRFCPTEQTGGKLSADVLQNRLEALESQREVIFELTIKRSDEQVRDCEFRITKLVFDDQELQQLIVRDITDKKIQEKEIMRQKMMLDAVINCNADNVMLIDTDFKIQLANKVFRDFYAELGHELTPGKSIFDLVKADQREAYKKRFERALNGESHTEETFYTFEDVATYSEVSRFPVFDEDGKVFGIGIVSRDITTRKKQEQEILDMNNRLMAQEEEMRQNMEEMQATQEQMREAQKEILDQQLRTQAIIDGSADNIFLFNADYTLAMANTNFFNWYKQNGADIKIGDNIFNYITPEEEQGYKQILNGVLAGKSFSFEKEYTFNDKVSIFEFDVFPAKDTQGQVMGAGFVTRDITERKRHERELLDMNNQLMAQEEELRQNMEELQATQEQMRQAQKEILEQQLKTQAIIDGSADNIFMLDTQNRIILANHNFFNWYKQFGADVHLGDDIFTYITPEEEPAYRQILKGILAGKSFSFEKEYTFQGKVSYFEFDVFPAKDTQGQVMGAGFVTRDITERKRQERELLDMNNQLMAQEEELRQNMEELQATQEQMRQAQMVILEQQQKTQAIIDGSTDYIALYNPDFTIAMANRNYFRWYKENGVEMQIGENIFNYVTPEETEGYMQIFKGALAGNAFTVEKDYTFNDKISTFAYDFFPAKDTKGNVMGVGMVARDITERKRHERELLDMNNQLLAQEEELRQNMEELQATQEQMRQAQMVILEQQQKTQAIIDGSSENIVLLDTDYNIILANHNFIDWYKKFGVEVEVGTNIFNFIDPIQADDYRKLFGAVLSGQSISFETPYDFGGSISHFELNFFPAKDQSGTIIGIGMVAREITERKRQEKELLDKNNELLSQEEELRQNMEELQATQEQMRKAQDTLQEQKAVLKQIVDALPLSVFWKDREGRYLGYNKPFLMSVAQSVDVSDENVLIGKSDDEMPWADVAKSTWPEYVEVMDSKQAKMRQEDHIVIEGMGEMWLRMSKVPLLDEKGTAFGVVGLYEDITAEKMTAKQIMETNQLLRRQTVILNQIVNALPLAIFWKDRTGHYLGYNKPFLFSVAQSVEVTNEDMLIGKTDDEMPWADVAKSTWPEYVAVMDSGEAKVNQEEQILMEGMPEMWLRMSKIPLKDESGDTFGVIGMFEDITASKVKA
jgi:PAS domain S-box-containing protein